MKTLDIFEIREVSGGIVSLSIQGPETDVILTHSNDSIVLAYGFGVGGNLLLKADGKAFINDVYIETSATPREIYTPLEYFSISSVSTPTGMYFKIVSLS